MSALRELIAFFGTEVDDKPLDRVNAKMDGISKTAAKLGAAIGVAFGLYELSSFIQGQISLGSELLHTSEMLGLTVQELQSFQFAAADAGISAEQADTALRFLNKNLGKAADGGKEVSAVFARLGVATKDAAGEVRPTQAVLADVAEGISKLKSPAQKTAAAIEIFGRAGARMIPLLNKGGDGIEELYREFERLGGGLDDNFIAAARKGEQGMVRLRLAGRGLVGVIATEILPAFSALVSYVTDAVRWFREFTTHSYIVQTALGTLAALGLGLAVVWGVLNVEILIVVAAIALLILIVDDVYTAFKGGKSVIGDFIDAIFGIGATKSMFDSLKFWASDAYTSLLELVNGLHLAWDLAKAAGNEIAHVINYALHGYRKEDEESYEAGKKQFSKALGARQARSDDLNALGYVENPDRSAEPGAKVRRAVSMTFGDPAAIAPRPSVGPPPGTSVVEHGDLTQHNQINVQVQGGQDARDTGKIVGASVVDAISDDNQAAFAAMPAGGGH